MIVEKSEKTYNENESESEDIKIYNDLSAVHQWQEENFKYDQDTKHYSLEGDLYDTEIKYAAVFKWPGAGRKVFVAGSFDNWKNKIRLDRTVSGHIDIINLKKGLHEYKYIVDGEWKH